MPLGCTYVAIMDNHSENELNAASMIVSSKYRVIVMQALMEHGPQTPGAIADRADVDIAHTSRALTELAEEGVVELLVDENRKKGRIYGATGDAEGAYEIVEGMMAE